MKKFYSTVGMMLTFGMAFAATGMHNTDIRSFDPSMAKAPVIQKSHMNKKAAKVPASVDEVIGQYMWVGWSAKSGDEQAYLQGDLTLYPGEGTNEVLALGINVLTTTPITGVYDASTGTLSFPDGQYLGQYTDGSGAVLDVYFKHFAWNSTGDGLDEVNTPFQFYFNEDGGIDTDFMDLFSVAVYQGNTLAGYVFLEYANMLAKRDATLNNNGWTNAGTAKVNEMWFQVLLEAGSDMIVGEYTVPYQVSTENPNLIRIVDPYGPNTPYGEYNLSLAEGCIYINTEYDDAVEVIRCYDLLLGYADQEQTEPIYAKCGYYSGLMLIDGAYYPGNEEGYYFYDGFDYSEIVTELAGRNSTFANNTITINDPLWGMSWYQHLDYTGFYQANDLGTPTIKLDNSGVEGINAEDLNAPVKYFNIQGQEISNPAKGQIVIKKQGNTVSKYIAR